MREDRKRMTNQGVQTKQEVWVNASLPETGKWTGTPSTKKTKHPSPERGGLTPPHHSQQNSGTEVIGQTVDADVADLDEAVAGQVEEVDLVATGNDSANGTMKGTAEVIRPVVSRLQTNERVAAHITGEPSRMTSRNSSMRVICLLKRMSTLARLTLLPKTELMQKQMLRARKLQLSRTQPTKK